jgi:hypothetical protein
MRFESSVTAVSWIPSEAIEGMPKVPFELGITTYDAPPPGQLAPGDLDELREANGFREANELRAWIEVDAGKIVGFAYSGRAIIGTTHVKIGPKRLAVLGVDFPLLQAEPEIGPGWVRFVQSAGGRMGLPAPRRVSGRPFVQIASASCWTTLELVLHADGTSTRRLSGASHFPRHWIYDESGTLAEKTGAIDFERWWRESYGSNTPWGGEDSPALVSAVETELERKLSRVVMSGSRGLARRELDEGEALVEQNEPGDTMFLVLDGLLDVEVDGETVARVGPGAVVGERALLEGGSRTSTLRAASRVRVVVIPGDAVDGTVLDELASGHRREVDDS